MEFIRINSSKEEQAEELISLYLEAFPETQRHTKEDFENLLDNNRLFNCNAVLMNDSLVGFFHYWDFDSFLFLEHIAIEPPLRGHKLGEKVINLIRTFNEKPMVIEVEPADNTEFGARRIEFYRRLGFEIVPHDYLQPPYQKGDEYIPLEMMSDNHEFATENFEQIKSTIYKYVYGVE